MNIIEVKDLTKTYKQGQKIINANNKINLSVKEGELIVIIGASGSGKSTLLQMLGGLDRPTSGEIILNGKNITKISETQTNQGYAVIFMALYFKTSTLYPP